MSFKVTHVCPNCRKSEVITFAVGELNEDREIIEMRCINGHIFQASLGVPKFAFMYENGLSAFRDGFFFEAFSCFYSALELFRIDFIKTYFCEIESHDINQVEDQLKYIKLSERIYGIYSMCYGLYFDDKADKIDKKNPKKKIISAEDKKLRNDVIHAGKIITENECRDLGYKIYEYIRTIYQTFVAPEFENDDIPAPAMMFFNSKKAFKLKEVVPSLTVIANDGNTSMQLNTIIDLDDLPSFDDLLIYNRQFDFLKKHNHKTPYNSATEQ